jgi:hypothetical protein
MSAVLSNSYFSILITLHRNLLPSNPGYPRPKPPPSSQSLAHCVEAARSAIYVASRTTVLVPVSHHIAVFCQYLWSSAVILLLCEVRAKEQLILDAVGAQVESCHHSLQALEPVWPGCCKLQALLTDVESRAKEVRANVIPPPKKRRSVAGATAAGAQRRTSATSTASASASAPRTLASPIAPVQTLTAPTFDRTGSGSSTTTAATAATATPYSAIPTLHGLDAGALGFFDVGDMNFDGLEMLKAFTSEAWQVPLPSPLERPNSGVPAHSPTTRLVPNGSNGSNTGNNATPPALGSAAIPSPVTSTSGPSSVPAAGAPSTGWFTHGLGPTAPSPAPGPNELHEMWAQITGSSFDWQADPSVPFSI